MVLETAAAATIMMFAQGIHHEAGNQSARAQKAVAEVVLNRVYSSKFPNTIEGVLTQDLGPKAHDCQFSYMCDGLPEEKNISDDIMEIARTYFDMYSAGKNTNTHITRGSTYYHADYVAPYWSKILSKKVQIEDHIFYAELVK